MLRAFTIFLVITTCFSDHIKPNSSLYDDITRQDKILSRKRRYLTFPAGSSIQLGIWDISIELSYVQLWLRHFLNSLFLQFIALPYQFTELVLYLQQQQPWHGCYHLVQMTFCHKGF